MINIRSYITISPRIIPSNTKQTIRIQPKYSFIEFKGEYTVSVLPRYRFPTGKYGTFSVVADNNQIEFSYEFAEEQEYIIQVVPLGEKGRTTRVISASVYALDKDLYSLKVAKGDLHLHTTYSDGLESPEHRLSVARKHGMDYLAITDHNGYPGSERAVNILKKCPNNMVALRGEEVHAEHCHVHILSIGADKAIAPQVTNQGAKREAQLLELAANYDLKDGVDPRSFASAMDVFKKIKEAGGLSVLCHIYWESFVAETNTRMGAPEQVVDALVENCIFDAFEITSGAPLSDLKANYLQEAYYREKLPAGFPIIGITDSHTTDQTQGSIFGSNYTIAFVSEFSESGIIDAIRNYQTVSIDAVSGSPICHGSLRLCKYASFLLSEYFPAHDEVVSTEGICMDRIILGDMSLLEKLAVLCKKNSALLNAEWGQIVPQNTNQP